MEERLYTVEQADAALPRLRAMLERLAEVRAEFDDPQRVQRIRSAIAGNGGGAAAASMEDAGQRIAAVVAEIESMGVILRDASSGLVDFPAERDGRPVYLCWRAGEDRVAHWHGRDAGFAGREPL